MKAGGYLYPVPSIASPELTTPKGIEEEEKQLGRDKIDGENKKTSIRS